MDVPGRPRERAGVPELPGQRSGDDGAVVADLVRQGRTLPLQPHLLRPQGPVRDVRAVHHGDDRRDRLQRRRPGGAGLHGDAASPSGRGIGHAARHGPRDDGVAGLPGQGGSRQQLHLAVRPGHFLPRIAGGLSARGHRHVPDVPARSAMPPRVPARAGAPRLRHRGDAGREAAGEVSHRAAGDDIRHRVQPLRLLRRVPAARPREGQRRFHNRGLVRARPPPPSPSAPGYEGEERVNVQAGAHGRAGGAQVRAAQRQAPAHRALPPVLAACRVGRLQVNEREHPHPR
mmetsp:Transcript_17219/g.51581  ORF Transcript_17219/g.51581 Transcript_17219/m.51581 type:complete len:288 (+) Transcript_17219:152-1015(+)